jgi:Holliday junction DNA helicase RuvA
MYLPNILSLKTAASAIRSSRRIRLFIRKEARKRFIHTIISEKTRIRCTVFNKGRKALFTKLLNVTGIGPKGALAILASGDPGAVIEAIENEDEAFLVKFPGVGKKTARQIILDLKGKLADVVPEMIADLFNHEEREKHDSGNGS